MNVLRKPSLLEVIQANEENMASAFAALYRNWDEALSHAGADVVWGLTRIPAAMINNATRVRFPEECAAEVLETILEVARERQVPMRWWLGPGTQPADLGERLEERGFSHAQLVGMAIELARMQVPRMDGALRVERVHDSGQLETWCRVVAPGFAVPQIAADGFGRAFAVLGLDSAEWSLYLGYLDGQPVAASSMYLGAGVAGIYNVATLPEARGKGVGSAVTYVPLNAAREGGYKIGTLQASKLGHNVYRRLGFEDICTFHLYVGPVEKAG